MLVVLVMTLMIASGCTPEPVATEPASPPDEMDTPESEPIPEPIGQGADQLGEALVERVESTSDDETYGEILTVYVTNPTTAEIVVTIPCGLIFEPGPGSEEQRLMVIQEASASLQPGEETTLTPYVICIDSSRDVPDDGSTYQIGVTASGDLLKLAQCICAETLEDIETDPLAFMDVFGLQFAVWSVSDGLSFDEMLDSMEEAGGALGEVGAAEFPEEIGDLVGGVMEMFQGGGQEWLEKCQIEINP
jgi:hypothetical protein